MYALILGIALRAVLLHHSPPPRNDLEVEVVGGGHRVVVAFVRKNLTRKYARMNCALFATLVYSLIC